MSDYNRHAVKGNEEDLVEYLLPKILEDKGPVKEKIQKHIISYCRSRMDKKRFSKSVIICEQEYEACLEYLLHHNFNVNPSDKDDREMVLSSLYCSIANYASVLEKFSTSFLDDIASEITSLFLKPNTKINCNPSQMSPLLAATFNGYSKVVKILLEHGACITVVDKFKNSLLHIAAERDYTNIAETLLQHNANVNAVNMSGMTALHLASRRNNLKMINTLLQNNVNIDYLNNDGRTALHIACDSMNPEAVQALLDHQADVNNKETVNGWTPLHFVTTSYIRHLYPGPRQAKLLKIAKLLLDKNADVNIKDKYGLTPLFIAGEYTDISIIDLLLKHIIKANYADCQAKTPLRIMMNNEDAGNLKNMLLDCDNHNHLINSQGKSLYHVAAKVPFAGSLIDRLVEYNFNINLKDDDGKTALFIATYGGCTDTVKCLLKHGADINIQNGVNGLTALEHALNYIIDLRNVLGAQLEELDYNGCSYMNGVLINGIKAYRIYIKTYKDIVNVLKKHIVKLKAAELYVSEESIDLLHEDIEVNYKDYATDDNIKPQDDKLTIDVNRLEDLYLREINHLKSARIVDDITFYNCLTDNIHNLTKLISNDSVKKALRSKDYLKKFPLYAHIIRSRFNQAVVRNQLLKVAEEYKVFDIFYKVSEKGIDEILSYMDNDELKTLINAVKSSQKYW